MTTGLKTTLIASASLAGLLNIIEFTNSYAQQAHASLVQSSAQTVSARPAIVAKAEVVASPVVTPATTAPAAPPVQSAPDPVAAAQTKLASTGLKPEFAASYLSVQAETGTPWQLLAAVHRVETGQSGDTSRASSAGAVGPMQFMPATFAHYALDGDGNGTATITDFDDALLTAGRYLAAGGAARGNYQTALYNYNHSNTYVNNVLAIAHRLGL